MKHSNKDSYKNSKIQQVEMVKRHYIDYVDGDWILWIVAKLYHNYETSDIAGIIEIKKVGGDTINIPYIVRKPYPNKQINQLSMRSGRKRLYGIPLVFQTFEELQEITEITIQWDAYEKWGLQGKLPKPLDVWFNSLVLKYHVAFEKDENEPSHRFFTISSSDQFYYVYEDMKTERIERGLEPDNYYNEFDTALGINGSLEWYVEGTETEFDCAEIFDLKETEDNMGIPLTAAEEKIVTYLGKIRPDKDTANRLLEEVVCQSEMQFHACYQEKSEILTASYMGDFITASTFGFIKPTKKDVVLLS